MGQCVFHCMLQFLWYLCHAAAQRISSDGSGLCVDTSGVGRFAGNWLGRVSPDAVAWLLGAITYNKIIQIPGFYYPPAEALTNAGSGVVLASERGGGDGGGSELSPTSMLASLVKDETGTHGSLPHSGAFAQT